MEIIIFLMTLSKMSIIIMIIIIKFRLAVFWTQDVIQFGTEMCHKCYFSGRLNGSDTRIQPRRFYFSA